MMCKPAMPNTAPTTAAVKKIWPSPNFVPKSVARQYPSILTVPCAAPSRWSTRPMGCAASSRKTRRGRNQTSCNGRIGSFGITKRAYAILIIDSSIKRDDSGLFQGYSHEQPYDREEMTDHGKEESEGKEASGSEGKARSCEEGRRQEGRQKGRQEKSEEGEQGEGCNEGEEGKESGSEEGARESCAAEVRAAEGCIGAQEPDGAAEARSSGRTAAGAGARSDAEQRLRTRASAAVDQH